MNDIIYPYQLKWWVPHGIGSQTLGRPARYCFVGMSPSATIDFSNIGFILVFAYESIDVVIQCVVPKEMLKVQPYC